MAEMEAEGLQTDNDFNNEMLVKYRAGPHDKSWESSIRSRSSSVSLSSRRRQTRPSCRSRSSTSLSSSNRRKCQWGEVCKSELEEKKQLDKTFNNANKEKMVQEEEQKEATDMDSNIFNIYNGAENIINMLDKSEFEEPADEFEMIQALEEQLRLHK